jgi:hypothetical protein
MGELSSLRAAAEQNGSTDFTPLWSGQAAALVREMPAKMLIDILVREATKFGGAADVRLRMPTKVRVGSKGDLTVLKRDLRSSPVNGRSSHRPRCFTPQSGQPTLQISSWRAGDVYESLHTSSPPPRHKAAIVRYRSLNLAIRRRRCRNTASPLAKADAMGSRSSVCVQASIVAIRHRTKRIRFFPTSAQAVR